LRRGTLSSLRKSASASHRSITFRSLPRYNGGSASPSLIAAAMSIVIAPLVFNRETHCEPIAVASPVAASTTSSQAINEEQSILMKAKNALISYMKSLYKDIKRFWSMFTRTTILILRFTPCVLTLPFVYTIQNKSFMNSNDINFWWWKYLRYSVRSQGPCTIKLCQWIATRPDLFPFTLCRNLQELQINGSPPSGATWEDANLAITNCIGNNWNEIYHIEPNKTSILGSGCVAQVLKVSFIELWLYTFLCYAMLCYAML